MKIIIVLIACLVIFGVAYGTMLQSSDSKGLRDSTGQTIGDNLRVEISPEEFHNELI